MGPGSFAAPGSSSCPPGRMVLTVSLAPCCVILMFYYLASAQPASRSKMAVDTAPNLARFHPLATRNATKKKKQKNEVYKGKATWSVHILWHPALTWLPVPVPAFAPGLEPFSAPSCSFQEVRPGLGLCFVANYVLMPGPTKFYCNFCCISAKLNYVHCRVQSPEGAAHGYGGWDC